jgi:hypothetical protein
MRKAFSIKAFALLLEFQRDFAASIAEPATGPISVYRNTVVSGCVDALRANYPVVARLLGNEMFDAIAAEHASQCLPRQPVLALYGSSFPDWLAEQGWLQEVPYLPHVARIERLHVETLFAADADALQMPDLESRSDWQALRLNLHPATRFAWLSAPAMSIWLAHRDDMPGKLELEWRAEGVLLTRPFFEVEPLRLERAGHRFLAGIRVGETVGAAAITTASLYPETDIGSLFTSLVNAGAFAATSHRSK